MIDLTLDSILVPDLLGYTPPFGTKVVRTAENKGGLSTREVSDNILAPFARMRAVEVDGDEATSGVEYDAKLVLVSAAARTLTLGNATYTGCRVLIVNGSEAKQSVAFASGQKAVSISAGADMEMRWNGAEWQTFSGQGMTFDGTTLWITIGDGR